MSAAFATATHKGLVRSTNEDSHFAMPPVFAVADGMGGAAAGEVASEIAAGSLGDFRPGEERPEPQLKRLLGAANSKIFQKAVDEEQLRGMGTTVTAAVVEDDRVVIAHVGDSRAYLWRDDRLVLLTEDHSLVGEMLRLGKIDPGDVESHPQRSIITRALGVDPEVEVDTLSLTWQENDLFLLCSDGLYSMVPEEEIAALLKQGGGLRQTANALIEAANARGGLDNITVVLFAPEGAPDGDGDEEEAAVRPAKKRRLPWPRTKVARLMTIAALVAAFLLAGGWLANRQVYYLDVDQGRLVIYRGVPVSIGPLELYGVYRESDVDFSSLQPYEQERLLKRELQSREEAERMLDNYEQRKNERRLEASGPGGNEGRV